MATWQHPTHELLAAVDGALPAAESAEVAAHLASCKECAAERDSLSLARALLPPAGAAEARPGFAGRVAARAAEAHVRPVGAPWWRWAFGGGFAVAGLAALLVVSGVGPRQPAPSQDLRVAQRLDLYEDMTVMQHQEALEDLDVVAVLHKLQPEARP